MSDLYQQKTIKLTVCGAAEQKMVTVCIITIHITQADVGAV